MNRNGLLGVVAMTGMLLLSAATWADTNVTLSDVHLCCNSCVKGVDTAVAPISGVKATSDRTAGTIVITAPDAASAQKAVDALVAAGYYGASSDAAVKVNAPTGASAGKVQTLEVGGVHLCCNKCVTTVRDILTNIDGVKGQTVKQRATSFTVTGDFEPKAVFEALNKAGLAGHVASGATTQPSAK
ncbi:MAG TPA: hypothetical protein VH518_17075 [Tepidisphaeraceae bacterium]|jgi:copper chaperone CopZ